MGGLRVIVLDTNVVSEALRARPEPRVVAWLRLRTEPVAITAVTAAELRAGACLLDDGRRREELVSGIEQLLAIHAADGLVLPFDDDASKEYAVVVAERRHSGQPISMADAQIAAICRATGAPLATRNTRDFVGTGVELVNPWE